MSPAPISRDDRAGLHRYRDSWRAIIKMVREGASWSGREKNCVFLNCFAGQSDDGKFADVSAVSGLGFADDARALGISDWDQDGDLDIWLRNRSAPRLRLMLNRTDTITPARKGILLKLRGVRCNRDAIGARVELISPPNRRQLRTVTAGDGFISQSSKWLHFAADQEVEQVTVHWPAGNSESISGVAGAGRYTIQQGSGHAIRLGDRSPVKLTPATHELPVATAAAHVVLPGRVPMPTLSLLPLHNTSFSELTASPTLIVLWSSSCTSCLKELANYTQQKEDFAQHGLRVLAVCLDGFGNLEAGERQPRSGSELLAQIKFPFDAAKTTEASIQRIRNFQNALFDMHPEFVVPLSLLLDAEQNVVAIYRGAFSADVIFRDLELLTMSDEELRDAAVPFVGSWFTKPATAADLAEFVGKRMMPHDIEEGQRYYQLALNATRDTAAQQRFREVLVAAQLQLARSQATANETEAARRHFEAALKIDPRSVNAHRDYAVLLLQLGELTEAEQHLRQALRIRPDDAQSQRNLQQLLRRQGRD